MLRVGRGSGRETIVRFGDGAILPARFNEKYLKTKRLRLGHLFTGEKTPLRAAASISNG